MTLNLKKSLGIGPIDLFGLDIGTTSVKLVRLEKKAGGYKCTAAAMIPIPNHTTDPEQKKANMVKAVVECFKNANTGTRNAVCGLSGTDVMVRGFSFPKIPLEAVEQAVLLEAQQVCPLDISSSTVEYQVISTGEDNDEAAVQGVLVVATNEAITEKSQLANCASLKNVLMDVDGLSLLNFLCEHEELNKNKSVAVLDVGNSFTNVIILGSNGLPFIRDLPYAANAIIQQIAAETNKSPEEIEQALQQSQEAGQLEDEISNSLNKAYQKLIVDISETIRYYTLQKHNSPIDKIFVCGGFALIKGFIDKLAEELPQKVSVLNPFEKVVCNAGPEGNKVLKKYGPMMAVATGLAMRSI